MIARAASLGVAASVLEAAASRPPHAVLVPLVVEGHDEAILRTFYVSLDPGGSRSDSLLEPDAAAAVESAIAEARRLAGATTRGHFRLAPARPGSLNDATLRGASLSAAAFVSAHALASRRTALPDVVITGRTVGTRIAGVGTIGAKVRAAIAAGAHTIVVPSSDRAEAERAAGRAIAVRAVATTTALLDHTLSPSASSADLGDLVERALEAARHGWRGYRWAEARELLERALTLVPRSALDRRVELFARFGAAERHLGALDRSARILDRAASILESERARALVPHETRARAHQQIAMTALGRGQFTSASTSAARALRSARRAASGRETVKALGCVGLVARARGRPREAVRAFEEGLELGLEVTPEDAARSRAYLVSALAATGELGRADREYHLALRETEREGSRSKEAWVRCEWAGALVAHGRLDAAAHVLDAAAVREAVARSPLPGLLLRRHLARTMLARPGREDDAIELLLAGEPSDVGEAGARLSADVNGWIALAARAKRRALEPGELARLVESLARVRRSGLGTHLAVPLRAVDAARRRGSAPALVVALDALVASAERLG